MKNTPSFQYYPNDLLSDPQVMFWPMEWLGAYWKMISYLWVNGGQLECDFHLISKLLNCRTQAKAKKLWANIEVKFVVENGIITHKRVTQEMQKQAESRLKRQNAGKKGADSRWGGDSNAIAMPFPKNGTSSSTPTPTSSSININKALSSESEIEPENPTDPQYNDPKFLKVIAVWQKTSNVPDERVTQYARTKIYESYLTHGAEVLKKKFAETKGANPAFILTQIDKEVANASNNQATETSPQIPEWKKKSGFIDHGDPAWHKANP